MTRSRRCGGRSTAFTTLASDLRVVGIASTADAWLKKCIVRTLIRKVIADIDDEAAEIVLMIHWMGGVHTDLHLPRRRKGKRTAPHPTLSRWSGTSC